VALGITSARFREAEKHLHFERNAALPPDNKMTKLRLILSLALVRFQQCGMFLKFLSADEQIVRYFGHNSIKMFINKQNYSLCCKIWVMASNEDYLFNIEV